MSALEPRFAAGRWITVSAIVFVLGAITAVVGLFVDSRRFFFSWLTAWTFFVGIAIGALALIMTGHAVRARWLVSTRRLAELPLATLPALVLLAIPLLFGLDELYGWVDPQRLAGAETRELVLHKQGWLNVPFFCVRTFVWLGFFTLLAWLLATWSLRQDQARSAALQLRMQAFSAACLPLLVIVATLASFDWLMSLHPTWQSTIFGIYFLAGGFLGALAFVTLVASSLASSGTLALEVSAAHRDSLARLLFSMVIFWVYIAFMQLLLIWIANIPREIEFFLVRSAGGWGAMSLVLGIVQFAVPFFLLLLRYVKRSPRALAAVGGWVLAAHYLDTHWLVMPVLDRAGPVVHWIDLGTLAAVGGFSVLVASLLYRGRPLVAVGDLQLAQSLRYQGS